MNSLKKYVYVLVYYQLFIFFLCRVEIYHMMRSGHKQFVVIFLVSFCPLKFTFSSFTHSIVIPASVCLGGERKPKVPKVLLRACHI